MPNPGTTTYAFSKFVNMSGWGHGVGDELKYKADLLVGGVTYHAADWIVEVEYGARPTGRVSGSAIQPRKALSVAAHDRRRED